MKKSQKRIKYIAVAAAIIAAAAIGTYIDNHEHDAFIVETHTVADDRFIPSAEPQTNGKININTAAAEELAELDGIGETLSQRIVEFRAENGPFLTLESIMLVDGIGSKMFESIKDQICVE